MILVTGATGMLGAHLLFELLQKELEIKAIKRRNSNLNQIKQIFSFYTPNPDSFLNRIKWIVADMLDYESIYEALTGIEYIYHCAAIVSFNPSDYNAMIENNVQGTSNLINAAIKHNIKKFCHVSSIAALGNEQDNTLITEESQRNPSFKYSAYSVSKFKSELEVWRGAEEGLNVIIVNPSVIIGSGDWKKGSPSIIYNIWKGLPFFTTGETGFVDVTDVAKVMKLLMENEITNQRYIVSAENLTYKNIFEQIALKLNKKTPSIHASNFLLEIAWRLDWLKSKLTFTPPTITKDLARSANSISLYSNSKLISSLDYKFTPIHKSIEIHTKNFIENYNKNNI